MPDATNPTDPLPLVADARGRVLWAQDAPGIVTRTTYDNDGCRLPPPEGEEPDAPFIVGD